MFRKTPIYWLQLRYQKAQTISAALGIAFITVLLFMQIGFRSSFLNTLTDLPASFKGDIYMLDATSLTILRTPPFSDRRLHQTLAFEEVAAITPIYWTNIVMRDPAGNPSYLRNVQALGIPLGTDVIDLPGVREQHDTLKRRRSFLIDTQSKKEFLPIIEAVRETGRYEIEVRGATDQVRIRIEGLFPLGVNTSANTHLIGSDTTFLDVFSRDRRMINVGLIHLHDGVDVDKAVARLSEHLPPDVKLASKAGVLANERAFYEFKTPIGVIFRFGLGGAVAVGIVILYQILFQIISKYVRDYATLKAIGFSAGSLKVIVLKSALLLAVVGFLPGLALSFVMYDSIAGATGLKFVMTADTSILVFAAICFICTVSAMLAVRKLRDADPADLFG